MISSSIVFVFCSLQDLLCVWCCHAEAQECVWQVRGVSLVYFHLPCFTQWVVVVVVLAEVWLNPLEVGEMNSLRERLHLQHHYAPLEWWLQKCDWTLSTLEVGEMGSPRERLYLTLHHYAPLQWWLQKWRQWHESFIAPSPLEWWLQKCRQWHESFTAPSSLEWWLQKCRQWHESFTAPSPLEWWLLKYRQWHKSLHHHHWNDDCKNVGSDTSHSLHHWNDDFTTGVMTAKMWLNPLEMGDMGKVAERDSMRERLYFLLHLHHWSDDCRNVDSDMSHSSHRHRSNDDCRKVDSDVSHSSNHHRWNDDCRNVDSDMSHLAVSWTVDGTVSWK